MKLSTQAAYKNQTSLPASNRKDLNLVSAFIRDPPAQSQLITLAHSQKFSAQLQVGNNPIYSYLLQQMQPCAFSLNCPYLDHTVYSTGCKYVALLDYIQRAYPPLEVGVGMFEDGFAFAGVPEID
jgi:hypothetical protein